MHASPSQCEASRFYTRNPTNVSGLKSVKDPWLCLYAGTRILFDLLNFYNSIAVRYFKLSPR